MFFHFAVLALLIFRCSLSSLLTRVCVCENLNVSVKKKEAKKYM